MHMSFNSLHAQVKELDLVIILHVWQLAIASLQETMANLIWYEGKNMCLFEHGLVGIYTYLTSFMLLFCEHHDKRAMDLLQLVSHVIKSSECDVMMIWNLFLDLGYKRIKIFIGNY